MLSIYPLKKSSFPLAHVQRPGINTYIPFPQGGDLHNLTFSILLSCIIFRYFISSASALAASLKVKKKVDVVKGEKCNMKIKKT